MSFIGDPLAYYGRRIIQDYHADLRTRLAQADSSDQVDACDASDRRFCPLPAQKVGILGAGMGGLYAALILDSLDIECEILEASEHTGGRVSTYKFPGGGKYDYYDMGAMRFPLPKKDTQGQYKDGVMKRLAELIEYEPLNEGPDQLKDHLIPLYYKTRKGSNPGFNYFNGIREPVSDARKGSFGAEEMGVDKDYIRAGMDAIMDDVTKPFIRMLSEDISTGQNKGWESLVANDLYSLRTYMANKYLPSAHLKLPPQHLPDNVITWFGLLQSTAAEHAFTEAIFRSISRGNNGSVDWKCLEGGSEVLPRKIEEYLNKKGMPIRFKKRVTRISQSKPCDEYAVDHEITIDGSPGPRTRSIKIPSVTITANDDEILHYHHVISTLPLSVLRTVDLSNAGLNVMQRNALQTSSYDNSFKIAILFKSNWWTTKLGIVGGQSYTDLPIGRIVYPSHGVDSSCPSKVLIASYISRTWADLLGTLAASRQSERFKELVLHNLAEVHSGLHPDVTYAYLQEQFIDMHVREWIRDEYAMGAFARFLPGSFRDIYPSLTYPAAGNCLHFAGEAVSTYHGWVVGALDSTWRAVYEYLKLTGQEEKIKKFKMLWGENPGWASNPSESVAAAGEKHQLDLLDEHLDLVERANRVLYRVITTEKRDVSFSYPSSKSERAALSGVSFTIQPGQLVVVVGANGGGKSTIIKLLSRFYDRTSGDIWIDGIPIEDYKMDELRKGVAMLTQEHQLFPLSVKENIQLGSYDAEVMNDEEKIRESASAAGADGLIKNLSDQYGTVLEPVKNSYLSYGGQGNRGLEAIHKKMEKPTSISGGEKQKLVAARTFMRLLTSPVKLVTVDEPSSALDPEAEYRLFANLRQARKGRTMIFVTHRFGHLTKHADLIICIKDGTVVETGTHTDLLAKEGEYAHLYNIQAQAFTTTS